MQVPYPGGERLLMGFIASPAGLDPLAASVDDRAA